VSLTGLDDPAALDKQRVGAKAAALAMARQICLPVLPGFVVETSVSRAPLEVGAAALTERGSGGARMAVSGAPVPAAVEIENAGRALGAILAVRSSSPLEGDGLWAGAFTSYTGVAPDELPKAVAGCWASVFSVDAVDRQTRLGFEPGSVPLAVLVQPAIHPTVGGVAEISPEGAVTVEAVAGSPAPLLQGWERGVVTTRDPAGAWDGDMTLIDSEMLDELAAALVASQDRFGFNRCEWGVDGSLWIMQLGTMTAFGPAPQRVVTTSPDLITVVQASVGGSRAIESHLAGAVVLDHGVRHQGVPASPGVGVGLRHVAGGVSPPPRAVVTAPQALPHLSQLIWEAAGLVTDLGSPLAHVFETARSLGVPAVCGVDLGPEAGQIVAVDGYTGVVAVVPVIP
jgi:pyruvate,water dikinase